MREPTKKTGNHPVVRCQVLGCEELLEKAYYKRCKICPEHSQHLSMVMGDQCVRFCCLCRRFHDVNDFEGEKRSCRKMLSVHNARRRKPKPKLTVRAVAPSNQAAPATSVIASTSSQALSPPAAGRALQLTSPVPLTPSPFQLVGVLQASSQVPEVANESAPHQLQPAQLVAQPRGLASSMAAADATSLDLPSMSSAELKDMLDWLPGLIGDVAAKPAAHSMLPMRQEQLNADREVHQPYQAPAAIQTQSLVQQVDCWRAGMSVLMTPALSSQSFAAPNSLLAGNMLSGLGLGTNPTMQSVPGQPCITAGTSTFPCDAQLAWPPQPAPHPTTSQPPPFLPGTGQPVAWQPVVALPSQEDVSQASSIEVMLNGSSVKLPEGLQQKVMDLLAVELGLGCMQKQ